MPLNLQSLLPQLLPNAIAWAESQAHHVQEVGQPLPESDIALARSVGVQHPELIRIKLVAQLPLPTESLLQEAAIQTRLIGPNTKAFTLGYSILVLQGHLTPRLLSHECRHVYQYETAGGIASFLPVYLQQIVTVDYDNSPLELDARAHEKNSA
jgi:hypothetical protein